MGQPDLLLPFFSIPIIKLQPESTPFPKEEPKKAEVTHSAPSVTQDASKVKIKGATTTASSTDLFADEKEDDLFASSKPAKVKQVLH